MYRHSDSVLWGVSCQSPCAYVVWSVEPTCWGQDVDLQHGGVLARVLARPMLWAAGTRQSAAGATPTLHVRAQQSSNAHHLQVKWAIPLSAKVVMDVSPCQCFPVYDTPKLQDLKITDSRWVSTWEHSLVVFFPCDILECRRKGASYKEKIGYGKVGVPCPCCP